MMLLREPVAMTLLVLSLTVWQHPAEQPSQIGTRSTEPLVESVEDISGRGFWTAIGCMGCLVGGIAIASRGWPAIVAAASLPKSSLVFGACIGACC
jgi:hypothetical protein